MKTGSTKGREDKGLSGCLYFGCVLGLLVMCCGMSVGFSVYNKYLFSGPIPAPILVTSTHRMFAFVGAFMIWMLASPSFYTRMKIEENPQMLKQILLIPVGFIMNIGMNNLSLQYTTLALNQLIRAFSPVSIAITSFFIEGKVQSVAKGASLSVLVAGVFLGVFSSPDFEIVGVLICAASLAGQSLSIVMTAYVMGGTRVKLAPWDVLLYATLPTLLVLLPWAYSLGEFDVMTQAIELHGIERIVGLIIAGGCLAFSYNVACVVFIRLTSSVYYGVTGGFRSALAIVISFFLFPQRITMLGIVGTVLAMAAFTANSYFTMKEKLAEKNDVPKPSEQRKLLDEEEDEEAIPVSREDLIRTKLLQ
mmetsp:Transcript_22354/g.35915  ORF Transcript_22354/g.35915 Transcript_22354/m.35915 type:complete len:363 (-) Transcript_22354:109-1197(-)